MLLHTHTHTFLLSLLMLHISIVCCRHCISVQYAVGTEPTQIVQNKFTLRFTLLLNSVPPRYNFGHFTFSPVKVISSHTYTAMLKHEMMNILLNKRYTSVTRYMCNNVQHFKLYNM
jgi:hypothetical protein